MEYDKKYNEKLYPDLPAVEPTAPVEDRSIGHNYRISKINDIQRKLEVERDKRRDLSKKYNRGVKWINNIDAALITASMGLVASGVGLLSTVVLAPVVVAMEGAALGSGLLSIIGKFVSKKLLIKAKKHERIKILAEAKLNTISDHISNALNDGEVSSEEFAFIISELRKFQEMKNDIKTNTKEEISETIKNSYIEEGRRQAQESFAQYFKKASASS